jgi:hypothetical protein
MTHSLWITRTSAKKKRCLDRGSNTGPLDLQSNALPTELSKQLYGGIRPTLGQEQRHFYSGSTRQTTFFVSAEPFSLQPWWYSVVVSISGCDPLDPGSNPGTAITFFCRLGVEYFWCAAISLTWAENASWVGCQCISAGRTLPPAETWVGATMPCLLETTQGH